MAYRFSKFTLEENILKDIPLDECPRILKKVLMYGEHFHHHHLIQFAGNYFPFHSFLSHQMSLPIQICCLL